MERKAASRPTDRNFTFVFVLFVLLSLTAYPKKNKVKLRVTDCRSFVDRNSAFLCVPCVDIMFSNYNTRRMGRKLEVFTIL